VQVELKAAEKNASRTEHIGADSTCTSVRIGNSSDEMGEESYHMSTVGEELDNSLQGPVPEDESSKSETVKPQIECEACSSKGKS
jgi:phosphatidate phosphatase LPIN